MATRHKPIKRPSTVKITMFITPELRDAMKAEALRQRRTQTALLSIALEREIARGQAEAAQAPTPTTSM